MKKMLRTPRVVQQKRNCSMQQQNMKDSRHKPCFGNAKMSYSKECNTSRRNRKKFPGSQLSCYNSRNSELFCQHRIDSSRPSNCDPLRCAKSRVHKCLHQIIYGGGICYKNPCSNYKLKAPLHCFRRIFTEPPFRTCHVNRKKINVLAKRQICGQRSCDCGNVTGEDEGYRVLCDEFNQFGEYLPDNQCKNCSYDRNCPVECSSSKVHFSCGEETIKFIEDLNGRECSGQQKTFHCSDSIVDLSEEEYRNEFSTSFPYDCSNSRSFNSKQDRTCKNPLGARCSCPIKTKSLAQPPCLIKEALKDFKSCQDLKTEKQRRKNIDLYETSNPYIKYMSCFELEKETLEYIRQCLCESQKKKEAVTSEVNEQSPVTEVLFERILDEKYERVASILEISENMRNAIGKDDLFTLITNDEFLQNLEDDIRKRYKKIFCDKMERLNRTLHIIYKIKYEKIGREELVKIFQEVGINFEGSIDKAMNEFNRKLFVDKLVRIQSIIELSEKMKNAMESNDYESILLKESSLQRKREKERKKTLKYEEKKNNINEHSESNDSFKEISPIISDSTKIIHENKHNFKPTIFRNAQKMNSLNKNTIDIEVKRNKCTTPVLKIDIGIDDDQMRVLSTALDHEQNSRCGRACPDCQKAFCKYKQLKRPESCFEIDACLNSLRALITSYDPFLSPYSPMRKIIEEKKLTKPKRMISSKKYFPTTQCRCPLITEREYTMAEQKIIPVSNLPNRINKIFKDESRDIGNLMKKWTGRTMMG